MRASYSAVALCAIGASSTAVVPGAAAGAVDVRQENAGTWYLVAFQPSCGSFGCNTDYAVFGAENAVPGAPAFALRCNTWVSCTSVFPGSDASATIPLYQGPLTITQKFTNEGVNKTASATVAWDGQSLTAATISVTVA